MADCVSCLPVMPSTGSSGRKCAHPWQQMSIDLTGQVVPCGYYSYASEGAGLGNANDEPVMDIWNGEAFQDLRRRHATGDLEGHPCHECMAYRMYPNAYPPFDFGALRHVDGHLFLATLPQDFFLKHADHAARIEITENETLLPLRSQRHREVAEMGGGRFFVHSDAVYLSSTDGSSPAANKRRYAARCCGETVSLIGLDPEAASTRNMTLAHEEYLAGETVLEASPSRIGIIESADCNIDCPNCSQNDVRLNGVRQRPGIAEEVLEQVPFLQEIVWQGGEPFLSRSFRRLIDGFKREDNPNLAVSFMSNGTMITEAVVEKLLRFPQLNAILSIDSFAEETFDSLRTGANYDRVMNGLGRLEAVKAWPSRKVSVQSVIGKTNFLELPSNLRFALTNGIALSVCPILHYPPTERLDCFEDFEAQTRGWEEALDAAEAVLAEARLEQNSTLLLHDPSGALREFREILSRERAAASNAVEIEVEIEDPDGRIDTMPAPAVCVHLVGHDLYTVAAYARLAPGARKATLRVSRERLAQGLELSLVADLLEPGTMHRESDAMLDPQAVGPLHRRIVVPSYTPRKKTLNIRFVKGNGHAPNGFDPTNKAAQLVREYDAERSWPGFLPNYYKPFLAKPGSSADGSWLREALATVERDGKRLHGPFRRIAGKMWSQAIPRSLGEERISSWLLYLDGKPLPFPNASHEEIKEQGAGRYCVGDGEILFSLPGDVDPTSTAVELSVVPGLPWEHSMGKRYGAAVRSSFEYRADGVWAGVPSGVHVARRHVLLRDDCLVGTAVMRDGRVRLASAAETAAGLDWADFRMVPGVAVTLAGPFKHLRDRLWWSDLPAQAPWGEKVGGAPSSVFLFQNGRQAPFPHAPHDDIASLGQGRFSHWEAGLWFSTIDGVDPSAAECLLQLVVPEPALEAVDA